MNIEDRAPNIEQLIYSNKYRTENIYFECKVNAYIDNRAVTETIICRALHLER